MPRKRPPPTEPHATDLQVQQRIAELLRIRLDGAEIWDICEYVREKVETRDQAGQHIGDPVWGKQPLSESQLYRYLERVKVMVAESCKQERKDLIDEHLAKRRNLYAKAVQQGDVRAALAVARDEAELLNLYPPKRTEMSGPNGGAIPLASVELTPDERAAAISALYARLGVADPRQAVDGTGDPVGQPLGETGTPDDPGRDDAGPLADAVTPLFQ